MKTIRVSASRSYNVTIGQGLLPHAARLLTPLIGGNKIAIISDSNVWPLYGDIVRLSLEKEGFSVHYYVFPGGEQEKNPQTYLNILNFLAENHFTRSDCLIALGGGVVGDLCGFAAATYLRGVDYIQIPTTLLAMVDSSVGGKTAIDLPSGKNLAGAFYQPIAVICDTDVLDTLPPNVLSDGCAEVIKYALLFDEELFDALEADGLGFDRNAVIARCVELKRNVVAEDEFDHGRRRLLNLGHTFGHAIEKISNYTISHGQAVAMGISIIVSGTADPHTADRIHQLLAKFGLSTVCPYEISQLLPLLKSDKKCSAGSITLITLATIGCPHCITVPLTQLTDLSGGM